MNYAFWIPWDDIDKLNASRCTMTGDHWAFEKDSEWEYYFEPCPYHRRTRQEIEACNYCDENGEIEIRDDEGQNK